MPSAMAPGTDSGAAARRPCVCVGASGWCWSWRLSPTTCCSKRARGSGTSRTGDWMRVMSGITTWSLEPSGSIASKKLRRPDPAHSSLRGRSSHCAKSTCPRRRVRSLRGQPSLRQVRRYLEASRRERSTRWDPTGPVCRNPCWLRRLLNRPGFAAASFLAKDARHAEEVPERAA